MTSAKRAKVGEQIEDQKLYASPSDTEQQASKDHENLNFGEHHQLLQRVQVLQAAAKRGASSLKVPTHSDVNWDPNDSNCEDCVMLDGATGIAGHQFWDEVEMRRHGFIDEHGKRRCNYNSNNNRQLCTDGDGDPLALTPRPVDTNTWLSDDGRPHIRFVDNVVNCYTFSPSTNHHSTKKAQHIDSDERGVHEHRLTKGGGRLKVIDSGESSGRAIFLEADNGSKLLLQRGAGLRALTAIPKPSKLASIK